MKTKIVFAISFIFLIIIPAQALEPGQILIIANSDIEASTRIAQYYCAKRDVPAGNVLALPLGKTLNDTISRANYEKLLAEPIRKKLSEPNFAGKIRCLLTTYGIAIKVTGRGKVKAYEYKLRELENLVVQEKRRLELLKFNTANYLKEKTEIDAKLRHLQSTIDWINGKETNASVDSELSMVQFSDYELYRWQPNSLKETIFDWDAKTLMVSRLDGPSEKIVLGLVDKALSTEKTGLKGIAYVDSRGIANDKKPYSYGYFDQSMRDLAETIKSHTSLPVKEEKTERLFGPNDCPNTAIYCGWYSLKKYIDSFHFVDGAVGYHIASFEAMDLRDPNSTQWCPQMLEHGITATLGAVAEPYLHSFPEPNAFFSELIDGRCLVEAYYRTNPFNSWQLVLIGDPLYIPFKKSDTLR